MPVEQEELRLLVNLIDNASAPLKTIGNNIAAIGGPEVKRAHEAARKEISELDLLVKRLTGDLGEAVKHLGGFRINLVQGAAGLVLFGWELAKQLTALKEYSDKLRDIKERAKEIGADQAHMKNMVDQLKAAGVESQRAEDAISNLVKSVSELQRAGVGIGSPLYTKLMQMAQTPQAKEHMSALINALIKGDTEEIAERTVAAGEDVRKNAEEAYTRAVKAKGRKPGPEEVMRAGADATRQFYGALNLSGSDAAALERVQKYKRLTAEQAAAETKRNEAALKFGEVYDRNIAKAEKLKEIITQPLFEPLTAVLNQFERFLDAAIRYAEAQRDTPSSPRTKRSFLDWIFPGVDLTTDVGRALLDFLKQQTEKAAPSLQKQSYLFDENNKQLAKLVTLLTPKEGVPGKGGGIINAAFITGGGVGGSGDDGGGVRGRGTRPRRGGYREIPDGTTAAVSATTGDDGPAAGNVGDDTKRAYAELEANPALKENFFRHVLGENDNPRGAQAVMEEARNRYSLRSQLRGNRGFAGHGNLSYFQGYYTGPISAAQRKMLEDNYHRVFVEGSDIAQGAIDNSSAGLAAKHRRTGAFVETIPPIAGESLQRPGTSESMTGERAAWPAWRKRQVEAAETRRAADRRQLDDNVFVKGTGKLSVNVNAPFQTAVRAKGDGILDKTEVNRNLPSQ
jgi:hypothetical protein